MRYYNTIPPNIELTCQDIWIPGWPSVFRGARIVQLIDLINPALFSRSRQLQRGWHNDMTNWILRSSAAAIIVFSPTALPAQESTDRAASNTEWSVFKAESPKECWSVSKPKESLITRDGQSVSVSRGDILLFVTFRPGSAKGAISFSGGYPFSPGSTVKMDIEGTRFELIPSGEWAWPASSRDDAAILAAMKKASAIVLVGKSAKSAQIQDTFSLRGFAASIEEAAKRCQ